MNDSLTWKQHVELRTGKANKLKDTTLKETLNLLAVTTLLNFYKSTPILAYGSNCYMPSKSDMRLLEKFRKKFRNASYRILINANDYDP